VLATVKQRGGMPPLNWKVKLITVFAGVMALSALVQLYLVVPYFFVHDALPWWMPFIPLGLLSVAFGGAWWVIWPIVSRQRRVEQKVRMSERRFRDITENAREMVWEVDADGIYTYVSPVCERILGYKPQEMLGQYLYHFSPPEERMQMMWQMRAYFAEKRALRDLVHRKVHRNGDVRWISSNIVPVLDKKHNLLGYQGSDIDITARRRSEMALKESEERMAAFMSSATDSFLIFDADLNLVSLNDNALKTRRSRRRKIIGKNVLELSANVRESGRYEKYLEVLRTGEPCRIEDVVDRLDGEKKYRSVSIFPVGSGLGIIATDISARKEMELRLQQQNEALDIQNEELISQSNELMRNQHELMQKSLELEGNSREKSRLLASMSHELRTPLNAIIGFSELMVDGVIGEINPEQGQCLNDILSSGHHLLDLINDILDMSKVEAGRMEVTITELDLGVVVNEAVKVVRPLVQKDMLELSVILEAGMPPVLADGNRVKQVLLNLLSNAIKFTPAGGAITVRTRRDAGVVRVSVEDTGCGIRKRDQEQIFKAYTQTDTLPGKKLEGTGLGLKLCRQFVELMGGGIGVSSRLHRGSVFTFTLPLAPVKTPAGDTAGDSRPGVVMEESIITEVYQAWRDGASHGTVRPRVKEDAVEP